MKTYAKLSNDGYVVGLSGSYEDGMVEYPPSGPGLTANRIKYVGGNFVVTNETWIPAPQYDLARSQAYPSIGDQLDMLWHAMDDGVMPQIEPFYSAIKAVKDAHPKPE